MSANKKVFLIVILGAGACLLSFILSQYYSEKNQENQNLLSRIQQIPGRMEYINLLSKSFIQNGDGTDWNKIIVNLERVSLSLSDTRTNDRWQEEILVINKLLADYYHILSRIHDPAVRLNEEKRKFKSIGLSFSKEVEERIIIPYREEEGLRLYEGKPIDPFKARIKETAYDVMGLHLQQQLILLELMLDWDMTGYQRKKQNIAEALNKQNAQLQYMNILMGNEPNIQNIIYSLDRKLTDLSRHEKIMLDLFSVLTERNADLIEIGNLLLDSGKKLSAEIVLDISEANRLNRILSWGLLITLIAGLAVLGTWLAKDIIRFVEDLKESGEKVRASESNLKVTLDSLGDAVIATDDRGIIARMNPSAEQLTGWNASEAVGLPLPEVFHIVNARSREKAANPVEKVLEEGKIVGLANHTVLIAKDGKEFQIADSGAPIRDPDGKIIGVVLVFRDVTEKYVQEQKIRENERQLKELTANVPGVVYQFKATSDHVYTADFISEKAYEIFGLETNVPAFFEDFIAQLPDDDKELFIASIRAAVDKIAPWSYEGRFIKPNGETIWFSGNSIPRMDGDTIVFYGMLTNITRRKQMEESLRLSQFCFDNASIGIFLMGDNGKIVHVNEQACRSLGYSSDELCNMTVLDIDPFVTPDQFERDVRKTEKRRNGHL